MRRSRSDVSHRDPLLALVASQFETCRKAPGSYIQ